jgi:hypothetical protein
LDDPSQGVALYKLAGSERVRTFYVSSDEHRSRNICFHDGGKAIISGSDHGEIYVFDRRTGEVNDVIDTGYKDWVQSVTVRGIWPKHRWYLMPMTQTAEIEGVPVIMIGRSGEKVGRIDIQVWEKKTLAAGSEGERRGRLLEGFSGWQMIFVLLSTLFLLQNLLPVSLLLVW